MPNNIIINNVAIADKHTYSLPLFSKNNNIVIQIHIIIDKLIIKKTKSFVEFLVGYDIILFIYFLDMIYFLYI